MTIARDSKSYPYLAIAQHYGVSYAEVLEYADLLDEYDPKILKIVLGNEWQDEVIALWRKKHETQN